MCSKIILPSPRNPILIVQGSVLPFLLTKVYLALLKYGLQSAKEISERADVPKNRVYDSVEKLKAKGFVEVTPGKPKKYSPVDPEACVGKHLDSLERTKEELEAVYSSEKGERPVRINYGRESAYESRFSEFEMAERTILGMVGLESATTQRTGMVEREMKKALDRGVEIKFLLNMDYEENKEKRSS